MNEYKGEHYILCIRCKSKINLPDFPISKEGDVRYETREKKIHLYAKCNNENCKYDNLYSVIDVS